MKLFTKLALVSAVAISGQAMAMESMDDSALSATTGQDGITLTIMTDEVKIGKLLIHDNDGLSTTATISPTTATLAGGTATAGAIVVNDISVKVDTAVAPAALGGALARVNIDTDANGGDAVLNVNMINNALDINVGGIAVAASNDTSTMTGARRGAGAETEILGAMNIKVGPSALNIQLGADAPQGAMIWANGVIAGGLTISGIDLQDHSVMGGGSIGIDSLKVTSANSANLTVNTKIGVTTNGLAIKSSGANDIYMSAVRLGSDVAASIGSVEIQGMEMVNSTVLVSGH
ncbi:hypothetical protein BKE30_01750 [Alkanindiges hydrocarboniclasticus]|uniref:DUF6160 domain-containing protein n=1 Tax=Alkanindiges hydrocarboniclasticus TaxID=1907941 RepID=A0A1S8CYW4_9GAMM|nr:DUF6160 family protein [Alkanindiges hydrocarboniclasticus]ONG42012.1 hypothetical protein BKE30_01750 [Alkanindiges hydrocarboniclasticus]